MAHNHIIHSLALSLRNLALLVSFTGVPRDSIYRLKLTINFGTLVNQITLAPVRSQIVAFISTLKNLNDLQIILTHIPIVDDGTVMTDWQNVRYELLYWMMPTLKGIVKGERVRIFPFVDGRGWNRVEFP
jgi:hypothetical protein